MRITITVPELSCTRCKATVAIQPHLLCLRGRAPVQFREALSRISREPSDVVAKTADHAWDVFIDERPLGWVKGPAGSDLCGDCAAQWEQANRDFMVLKPTIEVVDKTATTKEQEPQQPQTSSKPKRSAPYGALQVKPHGVRR